MKILLLGGGYLATALRERGHEVISAGHAGKPDLLINHPLTWQMLGRKLGDFKPDLFCYFDDGNLPLLIDPGACTCKSVYYSIDTYCNPWHPAYAGGFDLTLVAQKDFLPLFIETGLSAFWFPLFARGTFGQLPSFGSRDIPVAFVGNIGHKNNPDRGPFLAEFRKKQPLVQLTGDYRPIFNRSKIVINQTAFSELNFRCFEAMACGGALLMENCGNGLNEIFKPGENILPLYTRNDADEAAAIAREWLSRPSELRQLAEAGANLVRVRHSEAARAEDLEKIIDNFNFSAQANHSERKRMVRTAFGMIAAELERPEMALHREFYLTLAQD